MAFASKASTLQSLLNLAPLQNKEEQSLYFVNLFNEMYKG